jgi:hypothetical protein
MSRCCFQGLVFFVSCVFLRIEYERMKMMYEAYRTDVLD